jgi:hypothetical protein
MWYLKKKFPKLSDAKHKKGIFVGLHIGKLLHDNSFVLKLNFTHLAAWQSFKSLVHGFWVIKEENYK